MTKQKVVSTDCNIKWESSIGQKIKQNKIKTMVTLL